MRVLFGGLAVLLGAVSISLAARYGYKGADTVVDGLISGTVFGLIALCAFVFDAAGVRLWFMGHRIGAGAIGLIAAAALVVTFTNSLGAIASRADSTEAERVRAKADQADDRAELKRIMREREALSFTPTTEEEARAAHEAVATAERIRVAECAQRGPWCREREGEEQGKRDALAMVLASKAKTDRAATLDADAARVRTRLDKAPKVQNANPLGAVLEQMIGATATALTAWQQTIVAAVFEFCLVGVMVIFELLGHVRQPSTSNLTPQAEPKREYAMARPEIRAVMPIPRLEVVPAARKATKVGSVKTFVRDRMFPGAGERTEMKVLTRDYRAWCVQRDCEPITLPAFLDEIEKLCGKLDIEIEVGDDRRVYCLGVKLGNAAGQGGDGRRSAVPVRPA